MIVFAHMKFSPDSAVAVAETFGRIAPVPEFMKIIGPFIRSNIEEGILTVSIYECDDDHVEEAMAYLKARYASFEAIEGVTTSVEEWLGVGVALKLLEETNSVTDALDLVNFRF